MMFILRTFGYAPSAAEIKVKVPRKTPKIANGGAGKTDFFCIGEAAAIAALQAKGWGLSNCATAGTRTMMVGESLFPVMASIGKSATRRSR